MEGEYRILKASPSFKQVVESGTVSREGSETEGELPRYTSLKDVITSSMYGDHGANTINDPTNITIRNELVKHAASAYVLSATVISNPAMNKDQDWIPRIWERIKTSCVLGFQSCWQIGVGFPVEALCRPVVELFHLLVHTVRNGLRGRVEILT